MVLTAFSTTVKLSIGNIWSRFKKSKRKRRGRCCGGEYKRVKKKMATHTGLHAVKTAVTVQAFPGQVT